MAGRRTFKDSTRNKNKKKDDSIHSLLLELYKEDEAYCKDNACVHSSQVFFENTKERREKRAEGLGNKDRVRLLDKNRLREHRNRYLNTQRRGGNLLAGLEPLATQEEGMCMYFNCFDAANMLVCNPGCSVRVLLNASIIEPRPAPWRYCGSEW